MKESPIVSYCFVFCLLHMISQAYFLSGCQGRVVSCWHQDLWTSPGASTFYPTVQQISSSSSSINIIKYHGNITHQESQVLTEAQIWCVHWKNICLLYKCIKYTNIIIVWYMSLYDFKYTKCCFSARDRIVWIAFGEPEPDLQSGLALAVPATPASILLRGTSMHTITVRAACAVRSLDYRPYGDVRWIFFGRGT